MISIDSAFMERLLMKKIENVPSARLFCYGSLVLIGWFYIRRMINGETKRILNYLKCPKRNDSLSLTIFKDKRKEIVEGLLICQNYSIFTIIGSICLR